MQTHICIFIFFDSSTDDLMGDVREYRRLNYVIICINKNKRIKMKEKFKIWFAEARQNKMLLLFAVIGICFIGLELSSKYELVPTKAEPIVKEVVIVDKNLIAIDKAVEPVITPVVVPVAPVVLETKASNIFKADFSNYRYQKLKNGNNRYTLIKSTETGEMLFCVGRYKITSNVQAYVYICDPMNNIFYNKAEYADFMNRPENKKDAL